MKKRNNEEIKPLKIKLTDSNIKDFEKELEDYKTTHVLEQSIEYYGKPNIYNTKLVLNPIIGGCESHVVSYCLDNGIIKKVGNNWFVVAEEMDDRAGGICKTVAFNSFWEKWNGLQNLKMRRHFAQKTNQTELKTLSELKEKVGAIEDEIKIEDLGF